MAGPLPVRYLGFTSGYSPNIETTSSLGSSYFVKNTQNLAVQGVTASGSVTTPVVDLVNAGTTPGTINMSNSAGQSFQLRAVGADLFFDDQLLAKADDVQNIAQWANYPAMSDVNLNGRAVTDTTAPGNSITLSDEAGVSVRSPNEIFLSGGGGEGRLTLGSEEGGGEDPVTRVVELSCNNELRLLSNEVIVLETPRLQLNLNNQTGTSNQYLGADGNGNALWRFLPTPSNWSQFPATTPVALNNNPIVSPNLTLTGTNTVVLSANAASNIIDMNQAIARNGIRIATPGRLVLVSGGANGGSVTIGGQAAGDSSIRVTSPNNVLVEGTRVLLTGDAGGGYINQIDMSAGPNRSLVVSAENRLSLLSQEEMIMESSQLVINIGGETGLPGQVLTAVGGANDNAVWQDVPGLAALQSRVTELENRLAALEAPAA